MIKQLWAECSKLAFIVYVAIFLAALILGVALVIYGIAESVPAIVVTGAAFLTALAVWLVTEWRRLKRALEDR